MVKILEDEGNSRTKAIQKIINDHKDLKCFSRATIYRELSQKSKRKYEHLENNMLPQDSDVSNETFEKSQEKDENIVNITTSQYFYILDAILEGCGFLFFYQ